MLPCNQTLLISGVDGRAWIAYIIQGTTYSIDIDVLRTRMQIKYIGDASVADSPAIPQRLPSLDSGLILFSFETSKVFLGSARSPTTPHKAQCRKLLSPHVAAALARSSGIFAETWRRRRPVPRRQAPLEIYINFEIEAP
jgi:hypothetical protein